MLHPSHSSRFDHPNYRLFGDEYISLSSSLCSLLHSLVTSSLLGPYILLSTLLSNTVSLCSSFSVRDQVSHPYKLQVSNYSNTIRYAKYAAKLLLPHDVNSHTNHVSFPDEVKIRQSECKKSSHSTNFVLQIFISLALTSTNPNLGSTSLYSDLLASIVIICKTWFSKKHCCIFNPFRNSVVIKYT
jgi:hypothetical protein